MNKQNHERIFTFIGMVIPGKTLYFSVNMKLFIILKCNKIIEQVPCCPVIHYQYLCSRIVSQNVFDRGNIPPDGKLQCDLVPNLGEINTIWFIAGEMLGDLSLYKKQFTSSCTDNSYRHSVERQTR